MKEKLAKINRNALGLTSVWCLLLPHGVKPLYNIHLNYLLCGYSQSQIEPSHSGFNPLRHPQEVLIGLATLHKILRSVLCKPRLTKMFLTVCHPAFFAKFMSLPSKFSTEGCRTVIVTQYKSILLNLIAGLWLAHQYGIWISLSKPWS